MTVTNKPDHRGEHEGNRKTTRVRECRVKRWTCGGYTRVLSTLHARLRVHRRPAFPTPSDFWGGDFLHTSGASRRENAEVCLSVKVCLSVIAIATKQSIFHLAELQDGLLRFARNDGRGVAPHPHSSSPATGSAQRAAR
jgi:hypothetical protein